eukprot:COSAG02_NODE_41874_length_390_cov_0.646048_1_plen_81_part_10
MLRQLLEDEADKERHIPNRHGLRGECLSLWFLLPKALLPFFAAHCLPLWFLQCSSASCFSSSPGSSSSSAARCRPSRPGRA